MSNRPDHGLKNRNKCIKNVRKGWNWPGPGPYAFLTILNDFLQTSKTCDPGSYSPILPRRHLEATIKVAASAASPLTFHLQRASGGPLKTDDRRAG